MKILFVYLCATMAISSADQAYLLPAGYKSLLLHPLERTFSCTDKHYGYYADPENDCRIYHVCFPEYDNNGEVFVYQFSFVCPNMTIFNQETLTCTELTENVSCDQAPNYYDSANSNFFVIKNYVGNQNGQHPLQNLAENTTQNNPDSSQIKTGNQLNLSPPQNTISDE